MRSTNKGFAWADALLLLASTAVALVIMEFAIRHLPWSDQMGWSMVPRVSERVAQVAAKKDAKSRILVLGDSVTEWRDNTGAPYVRVAERQLADVEMVNLGEGGTGLSEYFMNLLRFGPQLRPEVVLIGIYLGNDLVPSIPPLNTIEVSTLPPAPKAPVNTWKDWAKQSVLLNYLFRIGKLHFQLLRSGFLEEAIDRLKAQTGKDDAFVASRLAAADPDLVDAARADAINVWDLATAIFYPDYYASLATAAPESVRGAEVELALRDISALITTARQQNARVAIVLLPPPVWVGERYLNYFRRLGYGDCGPTDGPVPVIERVKAHLASNGVPVLDVLPALRAEKERTYLKNDVHLDRHGHEVVGIELARFLVSEGLVAKRSPTQR
jgi:hypothetical protein